MTSATLLNPLCLTLEPFDPLYAPVVARWVETREQLHILAPGTAPPLTPAKVVGWKKKNGEAFVFVSESDPLPVGYAELNPMPHEPRHLWFGHVIIRPEERGRGLGRNLVRALTTHAFEHFGASQVSLIVFPENRAALHCYQSAGFKIVGEEFHEFNAPGRRMKLLRLEIRASQARRLPVC